MALQRGAELTGLHLASSPRVRKTKKPTLLSKFPGSAAGCDGATAIAPDAADRRYDCSSGQDHLPRGPPGSVRVDPDNGGTWFGGRHQSLGEVAPLAGDAGTSVHCRMHGAYETLVASALSGAQLGAVSNFLFDTPDSVEQGKARWLIGFCRKHGEE